MTCVLIKVYRGIVEDVVFFQDTGPAIEAMVVAVKAMNPEDDDAWLYTPNGMIANAKTFMDENDEFLDNVDIPIPVTTEEPLYIIGNPVHPLGFMAMSMDDPIAFRNPVEAISELGQMRKGFGRHFKLCRISFVIGPVAKRKDVEQYNKDYDLDDFDYSQVEEYLMP